MFRYKFVWVDAKGLPIMEVIGTDLVQLRIVTDRSWYQVPQEPAGIEFFEQRVGTPDNVWNLIDRYDDSSFAPLIIAHLRAYGPCTQGQLQTAMIEQATGINELNASKRVGQVLASLVRRGRIRPYDTGEPTAYEAIPD